MQFSLVNFIRKNYLLSLYYLVLSVLYGVVAGTAILGFFHIYNQPIVFLVCAALTVLILFLLFNEFRREYPLGKITDKPPLRGPNAVLAIAGGFLFIILIILPLVRWPFSPVSNQLTWDAGLYHFPKAVEMISTSSSWDLSIAYGEYPFGYESLVAFALLLNHTGFLIGTVHALIALFLFLILILILDTRLRMPLGIIIFLTSILFLSNRLFPAFDSNIWGILWSQVTLVGKNDLFLAAALLGIFFFTPRSSKGPFQPIGLAATSMLALSIKPTSGGVILVAWMVFFIFTAKSGQLKNLKNTLVAGFLLMIPGGLWIVRNYLVQGAMFSPEVLKLSEWSIASNLFNPNFYQFIPQHLFFALGLLMLAALFSIRGVTRWLDVIFGLAFLLTFILSPASGFFGSTLERTQVAWRFSVAFLILLYILLMEILDHFASRPLEKILTKKGARWILPMLAILFCAWGIWSQRDLLSTDSKRIILLRDQFDHPVGTNGYFSAYDFIQKNVRNATVIVENGLPFFLYDPGFTNSVTRSKPADYIVFIKFPDKDFNAFASQIGTVKWDKEWLIVYEDSQGRVYKRK
jgi:hypothetical protein